MRAIKKEALATAPHIGEGVPVLYNEMQPAVSAPPPETPRARHPPGILRSAEGFSNVSSSRANIPAITHRFASSNTRVAPVAARVALATLLIASTSLISGAGCVNRILHKKKGDASALPAKALPSVKTGPTVPKIDYATVRPNELGRIPVIMYHEISLTPGKKNSLTRTVADFQQDLQMLYDAGFRPVNLSDVIEDKIDVPAGKSPVVLTFDDARATQFKLIETPTSQQIDPNCAVGIMDAFHKAHPDWPMRATFFVLPQSKKTMEPFGQNGKGNDKLDYLVSHGMEIGNHTTLHLSLRDMTPEQIQQEIGNANNVLTAAVPNLKIETMAVPMGIFPHNPTYWKYLLDGTYEGKPYHHLAAMDAAWRPMVSPDDKKFKPTRLERIDGAAPGVNGIRDWITKLQNRSPYEPYVSDGDPNVISFPQGETSEANLEKIKAEGKLAHPYSPFGGLGGSKPIISADGSAATPTSGAAPMGAKPIIGSSNSGAAPAAPVAGAPAGGAGAPPVPTPAAVTVEPAPPVRKPITGN